MKDRAKIAAVALAFLALFGFLVFQAGVASRYQPAAAQSAQKSDEGEQGHIEPRSFGNWITHDAAGFFTAWLVIVGFGQAGLFVWQLLYMRQGMKDATMVAQAAQASAETAKEQVALTKMGVIDLERAYLAAGPTNIRKMIVTQLRLEDHGSTWETVVLIHVHNTGRTGATIVKLYGEFSQTPPEGNTPIYENGDWTETDLSIGADKESDLPMRFVSEWPEPQFFWGFVEYKDIFKHTRISRFCTFIYPSMDTKPGKYEMAGSLGWRECD